MHSMVVIVNTVIIHLKVAKRVDLKYSHHKKGMVIMWHSGGVG